jgi:hypothetical protein
MVAKDPSMAILKAAFKKFPLSAVIGYFFSPSNITL